MPQRENYNILENTNILYQTVL